MPVYRLCVSVSVKMVSPTLLTSPAPRVWCEAMSAPAAPAPDQNPPEILFPCPVFSTAFHPLADVLAVGLVSGKIELWVALRACMCLLVGVCECGWTGVWGWMLVCMIMPLHVP